MTTLALGSILARPLPLNWRRISALSGSFAAHVAIVILLLIPPVALELKHIVAQPEVTHGRILPDVTETKPAPPLPVPVQRQKIVITHPKPTITMEAPTRAPVDASSNAPVAGQVSDSGDHAAPPSGSGLADIGGGESAPQALGYGKTTQIPYPIIALRNHEQGTVMLRVLVGIDGRPQQIEIDRSSGSHALDVAARDAVRHWIFKPGTRGGVAYAAWALVPVAFSYPQ
jgi:protein TonB